MIILSVFSVLDSARYCHKHCVVLGPCILRTFTVNEQIFLLSSPTLNSYSIKVLTYVNISSRIYKHAILH